MTAPKRPQAGQLALDLARVIVVPNHWGPVYHLEDENGRTSFHPEQPQSFPTIEDAAQFAADHGKPAEVPQATRDQWADLTPEQITLYRQQCAQAQARAAAAAGPVSPWTHLRQIAQFKLIAAGRMPRPAGWKA